jgi:hypothetical protein
VADDGLGVGVAMMRVGINDPIVKEVSEPTLAKTFRVPFDQITAELVYGDLEN